ncbi:MAG: F0F1 ATP synthase subunit A [Rhodospirillaceae bacterium]|nr:F0F1 ATP synthase subunit A [Rhodospirillaceae bacterium]|tara:strand:+ start:163 stop:909 length:747 start_codon:yes stop_codon:yes gene_type:complete
MRISPDQTVLWEWHGLTLNATIVGTWVVMAILVIGSWLVTRRLTSTERPSHWQTLLEVIVEGAASQIRDVTEEDARRYLPFIATLFLFILVANLMDVVPGFETPTGSLSTTTALAICVLVAVPIFGIADRGFGAYLKRYLEPTIFMLPFNVIGEFSRTLALAVRLYGNVMSGTVIAGILIALTPLFFPVVMQLFGLLTGAIQAYIFAILAMVYIASATRSHPGGEAEAGGGTAEHPSASDEQGASRHG